MMEIANARITNVKVVFDDRNGLSVTMTFETQHGYCDWRFILSNPVDVRRLRKLMNYTDAIELKDLNGKIIRKVDLNFRIHGFGHPIEDKFVPIFTDEFTEISEAELETMLASK